MTTTAEPHCTTKRDRGCYNVSEAKFVRGTKTNHWTSLKLGTKPECEARSAGQRRPISESKGIIGPILPAIPSKIATAKPIVRTKIIGTVTSKQKMIVKPIEIIELKRIATTRASRMPRNENQGPKTPKEAQNSHKSGKCSFQPKKGTKAPTREKIVYPLG